MKKSIILIFLFLLLFLINLYLNINNTSATVSKLNNDVRAIFISYIDLNSLLVDKDETSMKLEIDNVIKNLANDKFDTIILHVRSFSDSIYNSKIFPPSYMVTGSEDNELSFDILEYFIEVAHRKNIEVHAWINPYRIRNTTSIKNITVKNPAYKWIGSNNVKIIENKGIYYNPASNDVLELILNGITEIINNYDIDGIHFDDYFYPDDTIDLENYEDYLKGGGTLSIKDYRYNVILNMISSVRDIINNSGKNIKFGISPEGNIKNNYDYNYLDIKTLLEKDYIDYIMPQIYFGFLNSYSPFVEVVNEWDNLIKNKNIKLYPALALYKAGNVDSYAKDGKDEWVFHDNIIVNQIKVSRNMNNYGGYSIFRYDIFYNPKNDICKNEVQNYRKFIKSIEN